MSQVTRCPSCGTLFRVVADQLRISGGWVRCGHCGDVFDARSHMQGGPPTAPPVKPPGAGATATASQPTSADGRAGVASADVPKPPSSVRRDASASLASPLSGEPARHPTDSLRASAVQETAPSPTAANAPAPAAAPTRKEPPRTAGAPTSESVPPATGWGWSSSRPPAAAEAVDSAFHSSLSAPTTTPESDDAEDVAFLQQARRAARWRHPAVRAGLGFMALLLFVALVLQVVVHERDLLAALKPPLRPWIQALCEPLGCTVEDPRRIDAINIEASTFRRTADQRYQLSFQLRNTAPFTVRTPAVELTLTDAQDRVLLRRVLKSEETNAPGALPAAGDWSSFLALGVDAAALGGEPVAGYRLFLFYP